MPTLRFIEHVRQIEERLFPDQLDPEDASRMKSPEYSWLYRPSHHAETGLIAEEDVQFLSQSDRRLLSIGAHPAYLERVLIELGIPRENILVADSDPDIAKTEGLPSVTFDMTKKWPDIGMFDRIIFPESLCIAIGDALPKVPGGSHENDPLEAKMLAHVLKEALSRLKPDGIIKANGPMSHPKVMQVASETLRREGMPHSFDYKRFFLTVVRGSAGLRIRKKTAFPSGLFPISLSFSLSCTGKCTEKALRGD